MPDRLPVHLIKKLTQAIRIEDLEASELIELFQIEPGIESFLPDGSSVTDPRNGDRVLFNAARANRPHDNRPPDATKIIGETTCIICQGRTTGIVDVAQLSQGYTFINKNLFPALFPFNAEQLSGSIAVPETGDREDSGTVRGLHFLQWSSSLHDRDWHNMPAADRLIVMQRLAALEEKLIIDSADLLQSTGPSTAGWVLITKNFGRLVGGSLAHGHQQIALSSVMPRRFADNLHFEQSRRESFLNYMLRENPPILTIKDYGPAVLLVPYFMCRPYDMMLLLKNSSRRYLHQLDKDELQAVADGWQDAIRIMRAILPATGREIAFNILTNNGPGAGLYFEFQPYSQEFGGFEQLGLLICQASPEKAAASIKQILTER
jgi:galactose-1-phosphate uridylyltransferase